MKAMRSPVLTRVSTPASTTRTLASPSVTPQRRSSLHTTQAQDASPPSSPTTTPSSRPGQSPWQSPHRGAHEPRESRMSFSLVSATISSPTSSAGTRSKAGEGSAGSSRTVFDEDVVEELRPIFAERASRGAVKLGKERVEMRSMTTGTGAEWVW
ncbi:hypothetical protein SODALDRAFT_6208 [Sodiomyces alkalinus F11]|uniref:Uncharacterized protein n=1 Tax=Sodiomyces alkalinus (strain CBS 110278 / VKM F-3762 / F11) TaxID=1314773 RepID=A0A3N2Q5N7_SODAK|nr:hypothetical protein SODALDRAFT_6208 [Sodiomyces alkalinus F11]ROT42060.1 hypothetical protein SODALDRAFT_6208 [Sodiomyces alkalinus F11]